MGKKRAGASADRRAKPAKKKSVAKRRKPTPRQTDLIKGIVSGKSTRQAALDAGYSERMSRHAGELLSSEALRTFCQQKLSLDKVLQRIDEGMDAELSQTVVLGRKGQETVQVSTYPNHSERRQAAMLAARLIGADPANKIEVSGDITAKVQVEYINVAALQEP